MMAFLPPFPFHIAAGLLIGRLEGAGQLAAVKYLKGESKSQSQFSLTMDNTLRNGTRRLLRLMLCIRLTFRTQRNRIGELITWRRVGANVKCFNPCSRISSASGTRGDTRSIPRRRARTLWPISPPTTLDQGQRFVGEENVAPQSWLLQAHSHELDMRNRRW